MKEVRWTKTAKQTLNETSEFILNLWNEQVKENFWINLNIESDNSNVTQN